MSAFEGRSASVANRRLEAQVTNMRIAIKQLGKMAKAEERKRQSELAQVDEKTRSGASKSVIRVHAENCIRHAHNNTKYIHMMSQIEAICERVSFAISTNGVTKNMFTIVQNIARFTRGQSIEEAAKMIHIFEKQFDNHDVQMSHMEGTIDRSCGITSIQRSEEVDDMITQMSKLCALDQTTDVVSIIPSAPTMHVHASPSAHQTAQHDRLRDEETAELLVRLANINPSNVNPLK